MQCRRAADLFCGLTNNFMKTGKYESPLVFPFWHLLPRCLYSPLKTDPLAATDNWERSGGHSFSSLSVF